MKPPNFEIQSHSGFLWLHFHSDSLLQYNGFMAQYEFKQHNLDLINKPLKKSKRNTYYSVL